MMYSKKYAQIRTFLQNGCFLERPKTDLQISSKFAKILVGQPLQVTTLTMKIRQ